MCRHGKLMPRTCATLVYIVFKIMSNYFHTKHLSTFIAAMDKIVTFTKSLNYKLRIRKILGRNESVKYFRSFTRSCNKFFTLLAALTMVT